MTMSSQTSKGTEIKTYKTVRPADPFRTLALRWTAKQFNCSESYVRRVDKELNLNGGVADDIRRAYRAKYEELKQVVA